MERLGKARLCREVDELLYFSFPGKLLMRSSSNFALAGSMLTLDLLEGETKENGRHKHRRMGVGRERQRMNENEERVQEQGREREKRNQK